MAKAVAARIGGTIAAVVRETVRAQGWLTALRDVPWVPLALIGRIFWSVAAPASAAVLPNAAKKGRAVAFGADWCAALAGLKGDGGARSLLQQASVGRMEPAPIGVLRDVDVFWGRSGEWAAKL